jgi:RibD domain-containing protein
VLLVVAVLGMIGNAGVGENTLHVALGGNDIFDAQGPANLFKTMAFFFPLTFLLDGGTTFHFLDATPVEALRTARDAADGQDVRIGGGPTVVRDFLAAGLVDHLHLVQVPIVLGRGVRIWDGLEGLETSYDVEAVSSPSGVTHLTLTRAAGS